MNRVMSFLLLRFVVLLLSLFPESSAFSSSGHSGSTNNAVDVKVQRRIPNVSPGEAFRGFVHYTWQRGGGLPVVVFLDKDDPRKRNLFLLGEEVLLNQKKKPINKNNNNNTPTSIHKEENRMSDVDIVQEYKLTKIGPIWQSEIEEGTHSGAVSFSTYTENGNQHDSNNNKKDAGDDENIISGTEITWNVSFRTLNRNNFWRSVTESSIIDACDNLKCYLSEPLLMTQTVPIYVSGNHENQKNQSSFSSMLCHPDVLAKTWVEFIWNKGGGLPLPLPPIPLTADGKDRIIVPPFLIERIVEIKELPEYTDIVYTVVNPSIITYPVRTHLGRVRFQPSLSSSSSGKRPSIDMIWHVSIRPLNNNVFLKKFVTVFTESIVSILARNFKSHIEDNGDDQIINIYPPQGLMKEQGALFQVRKDTWVGSVMYAHFRDNRSMIDHTTDLFRPWRWGELNGQNEGTVSWNVGDIPD